MNAPQDDGNLRRIQQWMHAVITHPDGVEAGIASPAARAAVDIPAGDVEQVIERSRAQSSIERLSIYAHAYYARLLECLRLEFPALVHALGEETFDGFAFGYLQTCPSRSYTLTDLAARFAGYLAETRPARDEPTNGQADWADFLIDLATLERTYSEVFDGPGVEGQPTVGPDEIGRLSPQQWAEATLVPAACLRLLSLRFPVHEYASGVRKGQRPEPPEPRPTWLIVTRRDYVVRRVAVERKEFELLSSLVAGQPIGVAIQHAAQRDGTAIDRLAASLRRWFTQWAAAGYFVSIRTPG